MAEVAQNANLHKRTLNCLYWGGPGGVWAGAGGGV